MWMDKCKRTGKWLLAILALLAGARLLFFTGPVRSPEPLPDAPIIDMHCHIACLDEKNGCYVSEDLRNNFRFPIYIRVMGGDIKRMQEEGDQIIADHLESQLAASRHVDAAVLLALDGVVENGELSLAKSMVVVPNAYVAEQAKRHPHLLFGASINPYRIDALQRLEQAKIDGAVLVKWIPSVMEINPADEAIIPFYQKLIELDLPLLTHAGNEHSFTDARNELADPRRLELPAKLGVTVIAAHIATTGSNDGISNFELLLPMMKQHPNLYADISSLTQINKLGYLNKAMAVEGLEKQLLYGTDWPLQFFPLTSPWFFPLNLSVGQMWELSDIDNQWDRDVRLKQAMGVPAKIFARSGKMLLQDRVALQP